MTTVVLRKIRSIAAATRRKGKGIKMDKDIVLSVLGRLVKGYRGSVRRDFREGAATFVDVAFPDLKRAAVCADTMCTRDPMPEFEDMAPRMALFADLMPGVVVKSIHDPVTLRFQVNDLWMVRVIENNPSE